MSEHLEQLKRLSELREYADGDSLWSESCGPAAEFVIAAGTTDFAALAADVERLELDAARYRWLRENLRGSHDPLDTEPQLIHSAGDPYAVRFDFREELDAAVDAAMTGDAE